MFVFVFVFVVVRVSVGVGVSVSMCKSWSEGFWGGMLTVSGPRKMTFSVLASTGTALL